MSEIERELDLACQTFGLWLKQAVPAALPGGRQSSKARGLSLVLPGGIRVEGLSKDELLEVLTALSGD